jgi:hypothetical protein
MRPTSTHDDTIFDFNSLPHPGTTFEHPRDVDGLQSFREARHPGVMGIKCVRDRVVPVGSGLPTA